jgi:hypothetical protein
MTPAYKDYILKFLFKYLFIFKCASDGWTIRYINKDKMTFYNNINNTTLLDTGSFLNYYKPRLWF